MASSCSCGSIGASFFRRSDIQYFLCSSCGSVYRENNLDYRLYKYPEVSNSHNPSDIDFTYTDIQIAESMYESFRKRLLPYVNPDSSRILDVGSGPGLLLRMIAKNHPLFKLSCVEPSGQAISHLEKIPGLRIYNQFWDHTILDTFEPNSFDLIMFHGNIMLHPSPIESLNLAATLLTPGGVLYFDYKNFFSLTRRVSILFSPFLPSKLNPLYTKLFHGLPWYQHPRLIKKQLAFAHLDFLESSPSPPRSFLFEPYSSSLLGRIHQLESLLGAGAWISMTMVKRDRS